MMPLKPRSFRQHGLSYVEILIAIALIAISIVPFSDTLRGAIDSVEADTSETENHFQLLQRMETVLAEPFADLTAAAAGVGVASSYSDAGGTPNRIVVYLSAYDADNADADNDPFTGTDSDIVWVQVAIEGSVRSFDALKVN